MPISHEKTKWVLFLTMLIFSTLSLLVCSKMYAEQKTIVSVNLPYLRNSIVLHMRNGQATDAEIMHDAKTEAKRLQSLVKKLAARYHWVVLSSEIVLSGVEDVTEQIERAFYEK